MQKPGHQTLVIALTGPVGSGVSTLASSLAKNGFKKISLSEPIKQKLRENENINGELPFRESDVPDFRRKLQDIGNEWRRKSPAYWVEKALENVDTSVDLVIDGVRNQAEIDELRERFSPNFFLIGLYASPDIRWARCQDVYDKNFKLFERDANRDSLEDCQEGQQVSKCVQRSDYVFVNEEDAGSSETQILKISEKIAPDLKLMRESNSSSSVEGFRRPPNKDEVHMATAYAQSHMSRCLKRHVGAVIVDLDNLPLSLGYNENPVSMLPCTQAYNYCFKDEDMHRKLEKMGNLKCPKCGHENSKLSSPWMCENPDCDENLKLLFFPSRNMELCTAIHAEERAIRSLHGRSAKDATIYTTTYPCFQCSRYIVDAGIKRVVYVEAYPITESQGFLLQNGITVDPFQGFKARAFNLIFKQVE